MARLLTICPYDLIPLRGGGALRSFHLLRQLARFHEVHAILFQSEASLRKEAEGYKVPDNVRIYSPIDTPAPRMWFDRLPRRIGPGLKYRWLRRSWQGPAEGELLSCHHLIRKVLGSQQIDAVVFEHRGTMKASPLVRRLCPSARLVLNTHNVDYRLMVEESSLGGTRECTPSMQKALARTQWEEDHLGRFVDAVWTCSEDDRRVLTAHNRIPCSVIPNGVDCSFFSFDANPSKAQSPFLIFTGALGTEANKDAVTWLIRDLWPRIVNERPDLRLLLVGAGMPAALAEEARAVPGVEVAGEVPDVRPYFQKASVALVPLRIGSGTRLKIMEAMAQGNPVISTGKGAEGLEATDGEHLLLANESGSLVQTLLRLLSDPARFHRLRQSARSFVEQRYDWNVIGNLANQAIDEILR
ncbi:MAG: glycosyltransferase [Verrucomicrobiia bacterium]